MSSRAERSRNNVKAGLFVSAGILLAFAIIVVLSDAKEFFQPKQEYRVRFTVASGVEGLAPGSPVRVGGLDRGRVDRVEPELTGDRVTALLVDIELDSDVHLYSNAQIERVSQLIGSTASINITNVGDGENGKPVPPDGIIDAVSGGGLARLIGAEAANRAQSILANLDVVLASVRADYAAHVAPTLERLDQAMQDAQAVIAAVRRDYPQWSEHVGATLANVDEAS